MLLNYYLLIKNWLQREEGQDVVEYAVLVIFIGLLILVGVGLFGDQMNDIYQAIAGRIASGLAGVPQP
jgi:Flp pilus assembly pilin Flp